MRVFQGEDKDTSLIEKLTTKEELSGLLNLAIIALKQLIKDMALSMLIMCMLYKRSIQNATAIEDFLVNNAELTRLI